MRLLAYAADERWAYVLEGECHLLLRPNRQDASVCKADVEYAVTVHGYMASDRDFATREELLGFLGAESVRVWRAHNPPIDDASLRERLLATRETDPAPGGRARGKKSKPTKINDRQSFALAYLRDHADRREDGQGWCAIPVPRPGFCNGTLILESSVLALARRGLAEVHPNGGVARIIQSGRDWLAANPRPAR